MLAQLDRTCAEAAGHFASYRFDLLAQTLYEFAWNQFCDWFVELAKPALNGDDAAAADSTRHTLLHVLDALLRLLHPLIPFVTEELWQAVAPKLGKSGSIMLQPYPQPGEIDAAGYARAEADIEWLKAMVSALRRIRSELGVSPGKQVSLLVRGGNADDASRVARFDAQLRFPARRLDASKRSPASRRLPRPLWSASEARAVTVPLEGLVDLDAERARLDTVKSRRFPRRRTRAAKLAKFGAGVPPAVVEQERVRLVDWRSRRRLRSALAPGPTRRPTSRCARSKRATAPNGNCCGTRGQRLYGREGRHRTIADRHRDDMAALSSIRRAGACAGRRTRRRHWLGLVHYLFHRSTILVEPTCYLQDLYTVEGDARQRNRRRIDRRGLRAGTKPALRAQYWQTHESNETAMRLYDRVADRSGFIVYRISLNSADSGSTRVLRATQRYHDRILAPVVRRRNNVRAADHVEALVVQSVACGLEGRTSRNTRIAPPPRATCSNARSMRCPWPRPRLPARRRG
ncbi:MAG: class I tRNA ligase family protein [Lysobacterales bacterium]